MMKAKSFKESLKDHQTELIANKSKVFYGACGGGIYKSNAYPHILDDSSNECNLFHEIRENVKVYFRENNISFWNGKGIPSNTLSSQICCLNHLFAVRVDEKAARRIMQSFVGDKLKIKNLEETEGGYISFEMVAKHDRMHEGTLTRGKNCTSIDAFAVACDYNGKKHILVIEWKLAEDDSGNKAPTNETSKNTEEISRGKTRVSRYKSMIGSSKYLIPQNNYYNSSLFHLPFYELMRQTLWAELCMEDFGASDYLHIHVMPEENAMRTKTYKCIGNIKGVEKSWRSHLSKEGNERYIVSNPYLVVEALEQTGNADKYKELVKYLKTRYY